MEVQTVAPSFNATWIQPGSAKGPSTVDGTADLEQLLRRCEPVRRIVHKDDHIYRSGDRFEAVYFINSGFVKTEILAEDGREVLTGVHLRGDLIGLEGLAGGVHACDAVALDVGEVWEVRFDRLFSLAGDCSDVHRALYDAMSAELRRDRTRMLNLSSLAAEQRVAWFLVELSQRLEQRGYSGVRLDLRMTRSEIGSYLGLKLETVSRCLTRLADSGMIKVSMKSVDILDPRQLRTYALRSAPVQ